MCVLCFVHGDSVAHVADPYPSHFLFSLHRQALERHKSVRRSFPRCAHAKTKFKLSSWLLDTPLAVYTTAHKYRSFRAFWSSQASLLSVSAPSFVGYHDVGIGGFQTSASRREIQPQSLGCTLSRPRHTSTSAIDSPFRLCCSQIRLPFLPNRASRLNAKARESHRRHAFQLGGRSASPVSQQAAAHFRGCLGVAAPPSSHRRRMH